jgi:hypothetical protein
MQMVLNIPDALAEKFNQVVPGRQQDEFMTRVLRDALALEEDPIYLAALAVEQDEALNAEMREWHDTFIADGIRENVDMEEPVDAAR